MDKGSVIGIFLFGAALFSVLLAIMLWGENARNDREGLIYQTGYCNALGGEIISGDTCVKNNQIVEIPPRP